MVARILKRDGVEDRAALLDVVRTQSAILGKSGYYDCVQRIGVRVSGRTGRFCQQSWRSTLRRNLKRLCELPAD